MLHGIRSGDTKAEAQKNVEAKILKYLGSGYVLETFFIYIYIALYIHIY